MYDISYCILMETASIKLPYLILCVFIHLNPVSQQCIYLEYSRNTCLPIGICMLYYLYVGVLAWNQNSFRN